VVVVLVLREALLDLELLVEAVVAAAVLAQMGLLLFLTLLILKKPLVEL
jgi:hypothetical protein